MAAVCCSWCRCWGHRAVAAAHGCTKGSLLLRRGASGKQRQPLGQRHVGGAQQEHGWNGRPVACRCRRRGQERVVMIPGEVDEPF